MRLFNFSIFSCQSCHGKAPWLKTLCQCCEEKLNFIFETKNLCSICALPLVSEKACFCAECISSPKYFDLVKSPFSYQSPVSELIQNFKFHKDLGAGKFLSQFLINFLNKNINKDCLDLPELIIPVPLHLKKLRKRGFNQSILIAKWVGQALKIPVNYKIIKRHKLTPAQVNLSREERLENLKNAFELVNKNKIKLLNIRHVALIDDVMTTGTTVNEISKILKQAGIEKIEVWCLARAIPEF